MTSEYIFIMGVNFVASHDVVVVKPGSEHRGVPEAGDTAGTKLTETRDTAGTKLTETRDSTVTKRVLSLPDIGVVGCVA